MAHDTGPFDGLVHHHIVEHIIARGHAPDVAALSKILDRDDHTIRESLERHEAIHGIVLHPGTHRIWVIHPFSLVPTLFWVETDDGGWWAPCIWCALGVVTLTGGRATIHTRIGGAFDAMQIRVDGDAIDPADLLAHVQVPIARAWDNVHRFCGTTLVFQSADQIRAWCARHGGAPGDIQPLARIQRLAQVWYGPYRSPTWTKWTVAQAAQIFECVGLTHPIWALPVEDGRF